MLSEKNMRILDDEIRKLEEKDLNWQTCDKLCMLYNLKKHMQEHGEHEGRKTHEAHYISKAMAEEWVDGMDGDDPAKPHGGKWTPDMVKPIAQKYGVPTEGDRFWEFYAVMNAMYSDYYSVAKKYNALNPDFFADMTMAFINDKDAVKNKVAAYYDYIVKG